MYTFGRFDHTMIEVQMWPGIMPLERSSMLIGQTVLNFCDFIVSASQFLSCFVNVEFYFGENLQSVGLPLTSSFLLEYSSEYLNEYSSTR